MKSRKAIVDLVVPCGAWSECAKRCSPRGTRPHSSKADLSLVEARGVDRVRAERRADGHSQRPLHRRRRRRRDRLLLQTAPLPRGYAPSPYLRDAVARRSAARAQRPGRRAWRRPGHARRHAPPTRRLEPLPAHVPDLEATVQILRDQGVRFRNDPVTGVGGKQVLAEDPSGNPVELFQRRDPTPSCPRRPDTWSEHVVIPGRMLFELVETPYSR
jgi:hypothetical protein